MDVTEFAMNSVHEDLLFGAQLEYFTEESRVGGMGRGPAHATQMQPCVRFVILGALKTKNTVERGVWDRFPTTLAGIQQFCTVDQQPWSLYIHPNTFIFLAWDSFQYHICLKLNLMKNQEDENKATTIKQNYTPLMIQQ